jgi:hypothetical protein
MTSLKSISETMIRGEKAIQFPLSIDYSFGVILDANDKEILQIRNISNYPIGANDEIGDWIVATLNARAKEEGLIPNVEV